LKSIGNEKTATKTASQQNSSPEVKRAQGSWGADLVCAVGGISVSRGRCISSAGLQVHQRCGRRTLPVFHGMMLFNCLNQNAFQF
jgi:hypothetical protein